jgi:hypothetical protein
MYLVFNTDGWQFPTLNGILIENDYYLIVVEAFLSEYIANHIISINRGSSNECRREVRYNNDDGAN